MSGVKDALAFFAAFYEAAEYAVRFYRQNPQNIRFWRHAKHADEYFWHTILLNSPLTDGVSNQRLQYARYISSTGHGATSGKENLDELKAASTDHFFAKRFDVTVDPAILDLIDREFLQDRYEHESSPRDSDSISGHRLPSEGV